MGMGAERGEGMRVCGSLWMAGWPQQCAQEWQGETKNGGSRWMVAKRESVCVERWAGMIRYMGVTKSIDRKEGGRSAGQCDISVRKA